jgi:hypothetical protein
MEDVIVDMTIVAGGLCHLLVGLLVLFAFMSPDAV